MDSFVIERWIRDRDVFVATARELGAEVNVQDAGADVKEQISQIEYFINKQVDVIVVIARDCGALSDAIQKAQSAGISVISYDRMVNNANTDLYISFDNRKVGEIMAQALVNALPQGGDVFMIQGSSSDNNVQMVKQGFDDMLADTDLHVVYEANCDGWTAELAAGYVEEALEKYPHVKGIMCGNDDIASQVVQVLAENQLAGNVVVVGQDGDLAACQRIVEGTQYMTAFKPIEDLARKAAKYAVEMGSGKGVAELEDVTETVNDGTYEIPSCILEPTAVTKENIDKVIIEGGFHRRDEVLSECGLQLNKIFRDYPAAFCRCKSKLVYSIILQQKCPVLCRAFFVFLKMSCFLPTMSRLPCAIVTSSRKREKRKKKWRIFTMRKKVVSAILCASMVAGMVVIPGVAVKADDKKLIGVTMPTKDLQRWNQDGENMKKELEAAGYEVDLQYASNDVSTQVSQLENQVANGCDLLVVASIDGSSLGEPLKQAKEAGIPVISYDRLLMNSDAVSYYATFDNYKVGQKQGEYLVDALDLDNQDGPFNIELFTGDPGDNNCNFFFGGAMDVLQKYIDEGKLVVKSGQTEFEQVATANWDSAKAQDRMDTIIAGNYSDGTNLDAVLCSNDSTALGVENALAASYTGEYPIITGQDCDTPNVKKPCSWKTGYVRIQRYTCSCICSC